MRDVLKRVMELQPKWSSKKTPGLDERGQLVRNSGPDWLRGFGAEITRNIGMPLDDLIIEGRDGTGPKTEVPWFRFGSKDRSPSATIGWYAVYLFDTAGETCYLCLGRGATEWNGVEFKPRDHDELRLQATWARDVVSDSIENMESTISLKSRRSILGPSYEAATAVAFAYNRALLPDEGKLKSDALHLATLLGRVYDSEASSPTAPVLAPEVRHAVEASDSAAGKKHASTSVGFQPNAKQRKAIEMRGMEVARSALADWGWDKIKDTSSNSPYDFYCESEDEKLYVEVKATTGNGSSIILTRNEVIHMQANHPNTALALVAMVKLPDDEDEPAYGGQLYFIHPWNVRESDLSIISYVYAPPMAESESWE